MAAKHARRKLFVDPEVQGALVTRCLVYWSMCLVVVFAGLLCPEYMFAKLGLVSPTAPSIWLRYAPGLVLAAAITPIMVLDLLRCTNRFAGPMIRTRRLIRALANGERVEPIAFRKGDYWRGYADDLNAVLRRIETLERKAGVAVAGRVDCAATEPQADEADADLVYSH